MIAEPGVLATSAFYSELFRETGSLDLFQDSFDNEEDYLTQTRQGSVVDYDSLGDSSHTPSVASSECGDDILVDVCIPSDISLVNWVNDNQLETSFSEMLETNLIDDLNLTPIWSMAEEFSQSLMGQDTEMQVLPNIPSPQTRKHNKTIDPFTIQFWSELSESEQTEAVETLSQVVSSRLGLREQLEVIRIIDPTAVISTADTEFVVEEPYDVIKSTPKAESTIDTDLNCIDDKKWHAVRDYVRKAQNFVQNKAGNSINDLNCIPSKSKILTNSRKKRSKKLSKKQQKLQMKREREREEDRKTKEKEQWMKEQESGLFVKEEVLSLSTCPVEEEIDILE